MEESLTIFPHLWRDRISVAVGVPLYRLFRPLPCFRERGRSLLLAASLPRGEGLAAYGMVDLGPCRGDAGRRRKRLRQQEDGME